MKAQVARDHLEILLQREVDKEAAAQKIDSARVAREVVDDGARRMHFRVGVALRARESRELERMPRASARGQHHLTTDQQLCVASAVGVLAEADRAFYEHT